MYKRMLRSVLGTVFAAGALLLVAHVSPPDVGWGNAPAAAANVHQADVGWGNSAVSRAEV
jgi:hypothetical protein